MQSLRDACGGCVELETGKSLILQNLQVPVSGLAGVLVRTRGQEPEVRVMDSKRSDNGQSLKGVALLP